MKTKPFPLKLNLAALVMAAITLLATPGVFAATLYYDNNGTTSGFGTTPGTWSSSGSSFWNQDPLGGSASGGFEPANYVTLITDGINFGSGSGGALATGTITVSGTVAAAGITYGNFSGQGDITLTGGTINLGSSGIYSYAGNDTINSAIALQASTTIMSPTLNNGTLTLGGAISGNFGVTFGGLNTAGSSQKILLNAASSYTGTTSISTAANSGANNIVQLGIDNALPTTTSVNLGGNNGSSTTVRWTRLDLNGHSQSISNLTASSILYRQLGVINSSGTLGTLTVSNATADSFIGQIGYYGGPFTPAALGAGGSTSYLGLTKQGVGTLTINPSRYNNYYTGPTTVSQGTLEFAGGAQLAYGNNYSATISIASSATLLFSGTAANPLTGAISGSGTLTNSGTGTVTLGNANSSFTGTMGVGAGSTLALNASGDVGGGTVVIGAGGTFDVSAYSSTYTLGSSASLTASGTGTTAGTTQATLKGGTTVSLGSQSITLNWGGGTSGTDTTHPCLVVSQGALTLSGNAFTINGSTLGVGTYRLIQVGTGSGANTTSGSPNATPTGTAIDGTKSNVVSVDGNGNVILTVSASGSSDANLTSLSLSPAGTLSPSFAIATTSYTTTEAAGATPTVTAVREESHATLQLIVNGGSPVTLTSGVASAAQSLTMGTANTITVKVTAQDGTIKNYTVTVTVPSGSPYYWDANDNTAGFGTAGGTWSATTAGTTTSGWSPDSTGATTVNGNSVLTGTGDTLNFGTATAGLAGGTITVSGTVNAGSLTIGSASGNITFSGGTAINLANSSTIDLGGTAPTFTTPLSISGATPSLLITNSGTIVFNGGTAGAGAGGTATISGGVTAQFKNANGLGGSTGFTVNLGDGTTAGSILIANSVGLANPIVAVAGTGNRTITLNDNNTTPAISGSITAHENLTINFLGYAAGKTPSVSGTGYSIDANKTVTFNMQSSGDVFTESAVWGGSGNILYTISGGATSSSGIFSISGAKTYSGGCAINNFTNGGSCAVSAASTTWPGTGPFGTGTLTLGQDAVLRSTISQDTIVGNAVAISGNVTFLTYAGEKSLIFSGNVDLGSATRNITNNVGATVAGKMVDFQGVISSGTAGVGLTQAGTGWLQLDNANTYTGPTTISSGMLALGSSGSINNSVTLAIGAGGTFDVSAKTTYTLSSSTALSASGTASAAIIKGGTTVSLGAQGITLNYDGSHAALTVSQGALTLNNNAFTVNGSTLGNGVYTLVSVTGGTINQSGSPSYAVSGTAIDGSKHNVISVSGGNVILTVSTPTIATAGSLGAVNTTYGTASPSPASFSVSGSSAQ